MNWIFTQRIAKILSNESYDDIMNSFSYEEKVDIINNNDTYECRLLMNTLREKKLKLFNLKESRIFFKDINNNKDYSYLENRILLFELDIELRDLFLDKGLFVEKLVNDCETFEKYYDYFDYRDVIENLPQDEIIKLLDDICYKRFFVDKEVNQELLVECMPLIDEKLIPKYFNYIDKYSRLQVLGGVQSIEVKKELFNDLPRYDKIQALQYIDDDDFKLKHLNAFTEDKAFIITSLNDDNTKIKLLNKYSFQLKKYDKIDILNSIKDEAVVADYVRKCKDVSILCGLYSKITEDVELQEKVLREVLSKKIKFDDLSSIIPFVLDPKIRMQLINNVTNYDINLTDCLNCDEIIYISKHFSDKDIKEKLKYYSNFNDLFLTINHNSIKILDLFDHIDYFTEYNHNLHYPLIEKTAREVNVNPKNLEKLVTLSSFEIIKNLKSDNFLKLCRLDEKKYDQIMMLFEKNIINDNLRNTVYITAIQNQFKFEQPDEYNAFSRLLHSIEDGNKEQAINIVNKVFETLNNNFGLTAEFVVDNLLTNDAFREQFHGIVQRYIRTKREEYVSEVMDSTMRKDRCVYYDYKQSANYLARVLPTDQIISDIQNNVSQLTNTNERLFALNTERLKSIIQFIKGEKTIDDLSPEEKSQIRVFNSVFAQCHRRISPKTIVKGIKLCFHQPDRNPNFILDVLSSLNIDRLDEKILSDETRFNELLSVIKKYAFLDWGDEFHDILAKADVDISASTIASLISNYDLVKEEIKDKNSLMYLIDAAKLYDSEASIYSYIFTEEDDKLIQGNPGPNRSHLKRTERIKLAVESIKKMQKKHHVPIPPLKKEYNCGNKKLEVCVEPSHSTRNMTVGERTQACARIGGAGSSLFNYCLLNENGFNIMFNNPKNGKFVSRVSGFRNGNTVFLNQLRFSVDPTYSSDDLVNSIKQFAKDLIAESKNSNLPIDNVFVTDGYVMANYRINVQNFSGKNIQQGLSEFYNDYGNSGILLASSSEDGKMVPMQLGKNNPKYESARVQIKQCEGKEACNMVGHIIACEQLFSGQEPDEIDALAINEKVKGIIFCVVGEDWYISVNSKYNVETYVAKNAKRKDVSNKELRESMKIVKAFTDMNKPSIKQSETQTYEYERTGGLTK